MTIKTLTGDCRQILKTLPDESVHCVVTSPPYFGLRDYGVTGQIGLEQTPDAYVAELVAVFREVRRVLRKDGTLWLNLGDSYNTTAAGNKTPSGISQKTSKRQSVDLVAYNTQRSTLISGLKPKDLIGIPWMVAFALRADGWWLRQDIIWAKPNPMPESVTDRCTKAHEYLFLFSKSGRYYFDQAAIAEESGYPVGTREDIPKGGFNGKTKEQAQPAFRAIRDTRNKRSVWTITTQPFSEAHFATFPPALIEPAIKAGCPREGTVLDPFAGAGTTGLVADRLQRSAILIELKPAYAVMARNRIHDDAPLFATSGFVEAAE